MKSLVAEEASDGYLEHLHQRSVRDLAKIFHIQVLVTNFFPTPPIKLELGLQIGGRLLIQTQLDRPNYLPH